MTTKYCDKHNYDYGAHFELGCPHCDEQAMTDYDAPVLPTITGELIDQFSETGLMAWNTADLKFHWTQDAVDFACLIGGNAADAIRDLREQKQKDNALLLKGGADLIVAWKQVEQMEAERDALAKDARPFPMQGGPPIQWSLARVVYAGYSAVFGSDQSLETIAARKGFGWAEVEHIYTNYPHGRRAIDAAIAGEKT